MGACNQRPVADSPLSSKDVISIFRQQLHDVEYSIRDVSYTLLSESEIKELVDDPKPFSTKSLEPPHPAVFWVIGSFYSPNEKSSGFIFIDSGRRVWILDPATWYLTPLRQKIIVLNISSLGR